MNQIKNGKEQNISTDLGLIGSKRDWLFRSLDLPIRLNFGLGDTPALERVNWCGKYNV